MRAQGICSVVASTSSKFKVGDSVVATCGWTEYAVLGEREATKLLQVQGLKETHFLGALGTTGITAMYGLDVVRTSSKDRVLVVSGAAGATGSMVVQIAKKLLGVEKGELCLDACECGLTQTQSLAWLARMKSAPG